MQKILYVMVSDNFQLGVIWNYLRYNINTGNVETGLNKQSWYTIHSKQDSIKIADTIMRKNNKIWGTNSNNVRCITKVP